MPGPTGFQELIVAPPIFGFIVADHLQRLVRVGFVVDELSDLSQPEFVTVEGPTMHQPHDHMIGHPTQKHGIFLELGGVPGEGEGADHAAHHRVPGCLADDL